jgi:hypothetical protein
MTKTILAAAAISALMSLPAHAAGQAASASPGQRCDRDGCWTYNCDATSNHCHRHWTSSAPRAAATPTDTKPDTSHPDQLCDSNGDNCADPNAPR